MGGSGGGGGFNATMVVVKTFILKLHAAETGNARNKQKPVPSSNIYGPLQLNHLHAHGHKAEAQPDVTETEHN